MVHTIPVGHYSNTAAVEAVYDVRAVELFRNDQERAFQVVNTSIDSPQTTSHAIYHLVREDRERFLELIGYLPVVVQDVFIQYWIMRRTQPQIAETLAIDQSSGVSRVLKLGVEAICAILAWGPDPRKMNGHAAAASYRSLLKRKNRNKAILYIKSPRNLGKFEVASNDRDLAQFFVHDTQQYFHARSHR